MMKINILGSGYMGKQIASLFTLIGFEVFIWYNQKETNLADNLNYEVKKLEKVLKLKNTGKINIIDQIGELKENLTIETVKEDINIKREVINNLKYKNNIFSNTSSLKLSDIGENVNGFHFMNPISMKYIEICKKNDYSKDNLKIVIEKLKEISYQIVNVQDTPGFLINKIIFKDISYFFYLIEKDNFDKQNILDVYKSKLNRNDPIRLINVIGIDTSLAILKNLNNYDKSFYVPQMLEQAVSKNILGFKNKKLFKL